MSLRVLVHRCNILISLGVYLYFLKKHIVVNVKILTFFIDPLQQFFLKKQLFIKFINKCQKEILRCAPPSSHVRDLREEMILLSVDGHCAKWEKKIRSRVVVFTKITLNMAIKYLLQNYYWNSNGVDHALFFADLFPHHCEIRWICPLQGNRT